MQLLMRTSIPGGVVCSKLTRGCARGVHPFCDSAKAWTQKVYLDTVLEARDIFSRDFFETLTCIVSIRYGLFCLDFTSLLGLFYLGTLFSCIHVLVRGRTFSYLFGKPILDPNYLVRGIYVLLHSNLMYLGVCAYKRDPHTIKEG